MNTFKEYLKATTNIVINESNNLSPDELNFQSNIKQVILKALDNDINSLGIGKVIKITLEDLISLDKQTYKDIKFWK